MKKVALAYALIQHGDKILLGIANTVEGAVDIIKKSGFGFHMNESELRLLALNKNSYNKEVNFKIEEWQVH